MSQQVLSRTVVVTNPSGLHLRPAALFARCAAGFQASVEVMKDAERVDGKSVLSLTSLCVEQGSSVTIFASGEDAEAALNALSAIMEQDFSREATENA
jgi:phosphotransferase system HPr (HPr) family protein